MKLSKVLPIDDEILLIHDKISLNGHRILQTIDKTRTTSDEILFRLIKNIAKCIENVPILYIKI